MSNQDHLRRQAQQDALQQKPQNTHGMHHQSANTYIAELKRIQNANNNKNNSTKK